MSDSDGEVLIARLVAAGWDVAGRRPGSYVRLLPPGSQEPVLIPLDPTAPDYAQTMSAAVAHLRQLADWGAVAGTALDGQEYPGPGSPADTAGAVRAALERSRLLTGPAAEYGTALIEVLDTVTRWHAQVLRHGGGPGPVIRVEDAATQIMDAMAGGLEIGGRQ